MKKLLLTLWLILFFLINSAHATITSGDFDSDGDTDGVDLAIFAESYDIDNFTLEDVDVFSSDFGKAGSGLPLGLNLGGIRSYSTGWAFIDIFKCAREWIPQYNSSSSPWDTGEPIDMDENGWVQSLADNQRVVTLIRDSHGVYPGGEYICLYDGEGTIEIIRDATIVSSEPGRMVLNVTPSTSGIEVRITATNPNNYIRNIRIFESRFESNYEELLFHPDFIEKFNMFKTYRFMDWGRTNNSTIENWEDRSTPDYFTQGAPRGVALEYMTALSNKLNIDCWICIPHLASDDYVTRCAELVRDNLKPGLKVYIEYSNEVWNGLFSQAEYARVTGLALGLSTNNFQAQLRYYSQRSVEIFQIFQNVFGSTGRIVRVLASQAANPWTGTTIMDWNNAYQHADVLAVAPYFGGFLGKPETAATVATYSIDQLLDECENQILNDVTIWIHTNYINASERGLELTAYEGGQHLVGYNGAENNTALTDLFIAANRHPRMGELYTLYLNQWKNNGGKNFMIYSSVYNPCKWGSWGILENMEQTSTPKYDACLGFID